jgi:hypothetical protein
MKKSVLLGMAAFGGLILVSMVLSNDDGPTTGTPDETPAAPTIPADFAGQFPLYPDSTVVNVRENEGETSFDASVGLETTATRDEIHTWYREALSQNGWGIKSDKNVAGYQIIQGEKDNLYTSLQVAGGDDPDTQRISQQLKIRKE